MYFLLSPRASARAQRRGLCVLLSVSLGLLVANLISPGSFVDPEAKARLLSEFQGMASAKSDSAANAPSMVDNLLQIIPTNPIESLATGNMLQIIFFALFLGVALTMLPKDERGEPKGGTIIRFFDDLQEAMIVLIILTHQ